MSVPTANLPMLKPEVGGDADQWGILLNANLDVIDNQFAPAGPGTVVRRDASGNATVSSLFVDAAAGIVRYLTFLTSSSKRWLLGAEITPETGGGTSAGSNFVLQRFDDTGALLGTSIAITRATGVVVFEATPQVGVNQIFHQGNTAALLGALSEPIGTVKMFAGSGGDPSTNYMLCDGRAVSRSTFPTLFTALGVAYGAGDGTTTFNIPNLAERVIIGKSATVSLVPNSNTLGATMGEGSHTLTVAELPSHNHTLTDPQHLHSISSGVQTTAGGGGPNSHAAVASNSPALNTELASTGITIAPAGSGAAHNNVQPSIVMNFIIRVL